MIRDATHRPIPPAMNTPSTFAAQIGNDTRPSAQNAMGSNSNNDASQKMMPPRNDCSA